MDAESIYDYLECQSSENTIHDSENNAEHIDAFDETDEYELMFNVITALSIVDPINGDFKDAIIRGVNHARLNELSQPCECCGTGTELIQYESHCNDELILFSGFAEELRLCEMERFYFPTITEIEGFELCGITVWTKAIAFHYRPPESDNSFIGVGNDITIMIDRLCDFVEPPQVTFANRVEWSDDYYSAPIWILTDDGMLYSDVMQRNLVAYSDDMLVQISIPQTIGDYEFLRNLMIEIVESAKLITI